MSGLESLLHQFNRLSFTDTESLTLPMTDSSWNALLSRPDCKQVFEYCSNSHGLPLEHITPVVLRLFNDMANGARDVAKDGGRQYLHIDNKGPSERPSDIPVGRSSSLFPDEPEKQVLRTRAKEIICFLWIKVFGVEVSPYVNGADIDYMTLAWQESNPHLLPKPQISRSSVMPSNINNYLVGYVNSEVSADVCFLIGEKRIYAHTIILYQLEYFTELFSGSLKELIGQRKDAVASTISDSETFLILLHYLYSQEVKPEWTKYIDDCLKLLHIAHQVKCRPLIDICVTRCYDLISKKTFLPILIAQFQLQHPELDTLCQWFTKFEPNFASTFTHYDLLEHNGGELLTLILVSRQYNIKDLEKACVASLKQVLDLNNGFIALCKKILETKDRQLRSILMDAVKDKPEIYKSMKTKDYYKQQWKLYKSIMLDPAYL